MVEADIKFPLFNIFQTPFGFSKLKIDGTLELSQNSPFQRGTIKRQVNFEDIHFAEELYTHTYFELYGKEYSKESKLKLRIDNQYTASASPPNSGATELDMSVITLNMRVPYQERIRVKLPILESFKLACIQYFSFFILVYYIVYEVMLGYAFKNNILDTSTFSEIHYINKNTTLINRPKQIN